MPTLSAAPKAKIAQPLARPRPHLPDAGGAAAPCRHPLHLFRSYRSEVLLRLRHDRARHRQLLHGDVLLPVGPVCLAGHRPEGTAELFVAIACFGLACHSRSARSRSFRSPITPSRCGTIPRSAFRNSGGTRSRRARGRADRSGSSGSCSPSTWLPASCTGCRPTCSIRSIASRCTAAAGPRCSSRSCLPSPPRSTFPG